MRIVVDTNCLCDDFLLDFLKKSKRNHAVLCDYVAMEFYKKDPLKYLFPTMKILKKFPSQVIILKGTQKIVQQKGKKANLQKRLIDSKQTREFPQFCKNLEITNSGDERFVSSILEHRNAASEHMDNLLHIFSDMNNSIIDFTNCYTNPELKIIRSRDDYSESIMRKMIEHTLLLTKDLFERLNSNTRLPTVQQLPNTYIFRCSLLHYIAVMDWIRVGGMRDANAENIRNDMVDVHIATYATYFDGLMTKEKRLKARYETAIYLLRNMCDAEVPSYTRIYS